MKWARYSGVTAAVGMPGGGKSYMLVEAAARAIKRDVPVYSNAGFDVEGTTVLDSFEDFASVTGPALIVWDELPLYFSARRWSDFPDGMLYKFTQIRKDGLRLMYSTIHEDMVDVAIRRITFWYWHCWAVTDRILRRALYPAHEFRRANARPYRREWVRVRTDVARLYDSWGKVAIQEKPRERMETMEDSHWSVPQVGGTVVDGIVDDGLDVHGEAVHPWEQLEGGVGAPPPGERQGGGTRLTSGATRTGRHHEDRRSDPGGG